MSLPIAILIWAMMAQIDFSAVLGVRKEPKGLAITTVVNWLIKPFTMFAIAWFFLMVVFEPWIAPKLASEYLAGAILLIAVPLIVQTFLIFFLAYGWARLWKVRHCIAAPGAMIGASNFFELAVAAAIALFGLQSGAAFATVVGVLVEVPLMLMLVKIANRTRDRFPAWAPRPAPGIDHGAGITRIICSVQPHPANIAANISDALTLTEYTQWTFSRRFSLAFSRD